MSWKSSVAIHVGFWCYVIFGGVVFYVIETPMHNLPPSNEIIVNANFCQQLEVAENEKMKLFYTDSSWTNAELNAFKVSQQLFQEVCANLTNEATPTQNGGDSWEFSSALFLSMTILTTIGYGNVYPIKPAGKIFCILYGFIGIPFTGLLLAKTSDYFSRVLLQLYERQRKKSDVEEKKRNIFLASIIFLTPGLAMFLFIPAGIFVGLEGWSYLDSIYYGFVTLSTIGFGDIVAAQHLSQNWLWFYRVSWMIWVILGISYWAIIISFITKAFKSKQLRRRWEKTSQAIVEQASEMRRVVQHQLSSAIQHDDSFLALKSKTVFEFALQLTGSMSHLESDVDCHRRLNLPGIATAFKPHQSHYPGIHSLLTMLPRRQEQNKQTTTDEHDQPATEIGDTNDCETKLEHTVEDETSNIGSIKKRSISKDSGYVNEILHSLDDGSICSLPQPSQRTERQSTFSKTDSTKSLPIVHAPLAEPQVMQPNSRWKMLSRSQTRPELRKQESSNFHKLLIEAMLILHEAEDSKTVLSLRE